MTIALSDNTPRISYTVAQGVTRTSPFPVPFVFFTASTDLNVFVDGVERTFDASTSNTTLYTVTGGDGSTGAVTTTVTGATGGSTVVITRSIPLERTTDFPSSGAFEVAKLNTELDTLLTMITDADDENSRALRLQDSDEAVSLTLPLKDARKGTVLGFNATTGAAEAGPTIANVTTLASITSSINTLGGISADITTVAHLEDGTTATNAVSGVASISTQIQGVNAISTEVQQAYTDRVAIQNASANATKAQNYAIKVDGEAETGVGEASAKAHAIGDDGSIVTALTGAAKEWASKTTGQVDNTSPALFSAKEYAVGTQTANTTGSAKQWALGGGTNYDANTTVDGSLYSARYYAQLAESYVDNFDDTYLGAKATDPTLDNDGDALTAGDLYFNTTSNVMKVYNGSAWNAVATDTSAFASKGFAVAMAIAL